jgi:hypothetical protein
MLISVCSQAYPSELSDAVARALAARGIGNVTRNFEAVLVVVAASSAADASSRVWYSALPGAAWEASRGSAR